MKFNVQIILNLTFIGSTLIIVGLFFFREQSNLIYNSFILVGGLLNVIGLFLYRSETKRIQSERHNEVTDLINKNKELSGQLISKTEIVNSEITGGNSYLMVWIHYNIKTKVFDVSAIIDGDYNMKNVYLTITENKKKVYENTIQGMNTKTSHTLMKITPPTNRNLLLYSIHVNAKNGSYFQHVLLKKHSDEIWYGHTIYYADQYQQWFRGEEYFPYSYPQELKNNKPLISDYISLDRENKKAISVTEDMLKSGHFPINRISDMTGMPMHIVEKLKKENKASK